MIETILEYIQKTNPGMTKEKLIHELSISDYSAKSLAYVIQNTAARE